MWRWLVWIKACGEWRYAGDYSIESMEFDSVCSSVILLGGECNISLVWTGSE